MSGTSPIRRAAEIVWARRAVHAAIPHSAYMAYLARRTRCFATSAEDAEAFGVPLAPTPAGPNGNRTA